MRRQLLAAVGAVGLGLAATGAPTPVPTAEQLVARLGADHFADREAAAAALEAAGAAAVPALEAAAGGPNPEVAVRAAAVLAKVRRAEQSRTRVVAKTVRLAYQDVPLGAAVNDLKARTGIPLTLSPTDVADPLRPVTCATGDLPAWEAVEAFCRAAGVREVFAAELDVPKVEQRRNRSYYAPLPPPAAADAVPVLLADGKAAPIPGSRATAVRVLALPAAFPGHRVTLGTGDVTLNFDVMPVPGLNWQDVAAVRVTKVVDDAGRPGGGGLVDAAPPVYSPYGGQVFFAGAGGMVWDSYGAVSPSAYPNPRVVPVPLKLATPSARSLKLLEGAVVCELAVPGQPLVTVENVPGAIGTETEGAGGVRVVVQEARAGGATAVPVIRVRLDVPSPSARRRARNPLAMMWPEQPQPAGAGTQFQLFAADGKLVPAQTSMTDISDDGATLTTVTQLVLPRGSGLPAKLVVAGPKPVAVEVPFRMENVPLP